MAFFHIVAQHERRTLKLVRPAVPDRLARRTALSPQDQVVEHRRTGYVVAPAERDLRRGAALPVGVGERLEIRSDHDVGRVGAHLRIDKRLQVVPGAAAGIETAGIMRSDVGVIEDLLVDLAGYEALGRTEHVSLVATASGRLAAALDIGRNLRITPVSIGAVRVFHLVAGMTRSGDPQRTMIFSAEANRIVTRFVAAYRKVGADVIGVIVVAVRNLDRQFGPARILGRTRISAAAVRRGGEGRRGAGVGLPAPVGAEREFIGRAGRQAGQSRRLGSRSRRNVYPVIAARRSRLIPEIDVVVGRIFEIERTAQRRLGLGHARRRRSSESGPFGIGVGHVVLPGFEDRPCALNPSGRQAGIGENHVARFGLKPGQRGGNAGAVNRGTRHIGKRADFIVDNGSIGLEFNL